MMPPQGFAGYQDFYVEIWQDEREAWWAFLHLAPAGAMRTHHATGKGFPIPGGPWTNRDEVIEAAKTACNAARGLRAPLVTPRCSGARRGRLGRKIGRGSSRSD